MKQIYQWYLVLDSVTNIYRVYKNYSGKFIYVRFFQYIDTQEWQFTSVKVKMTDFLTNNSP